MVLDIAIANLVKQGKKINKIQYLYFDLNDPGLRMSSINKKRDIHVEFSNRMDLIIYILITDLIVPLLCCERENTFGLNIDDKPA